MADPDDRENDALIGKDDAIVADPEPQRLDALQRFDLIRQRFWGHRQLHNLFLDPILNLSRQTQELPGCLVGPDDRSNEACYSAKLYLFEPEL